LAAAEALACPFCTALKPTLSQRRDEASVVALGELVRAGTADRDIRLHNVLKGSESLGAKVRLELELTDIGEGAQIKPGGLVLLLGKSLSPEEESGGLIWDLLPVNEVGYSYVLRSPPLRLPAEQRLPFFARYLEHGEPLLAEDAYLEFGHAPYDQVAAAADSLPMDSLRRWLRDPLVPQERKGFYGLALGLGRNEHERRSNAEFLRELILEPASDFRAGFDGILGGYLIAAGEPALELIEQQFLANPDAPQGDMRHALTALRFYREYGQAIPTERQEQALRLLLDRPELAAAVIVDLSRWQDWSALDKIASLHSRPGYTEPAVQRAIIGYMLVCPLPEAATQLAKLRQLDPRRVAEAEKYLSTFGGF
jgi:hypothetical protein